MTKDELLDKLETLSSHNKSGVMLTLIKSFFSQNVCIPKGENRHPDADAIHQLAERTSIVEIKSNDEHSAGWGTEGVDDFSYRIKPSEPVYEYLHYDRAGRTLWATKEDAPSNMWRAEQTKRIRNAME